MTNFSYFIERSDNDTNNTLKQLDLDLASDDELEILSDRDLPRYIYFYGVSVIVPVGVVCNALSFAVFVGSQTLRRTTTGHYLIALSIADIIFLLGEMLR